MAVMYGRSSQHYVSTLIVCLMTFIGCNCTQLDTVDQSPMSTYYLDADGHCQSGTKVSKVTDGSAKAGIIYSHKPYGQPGHTYPDGDRNCIITLWVQPGYRIRLTALEFAVNGTPPLCKRDSFHVFDHKTPFAKQELSTNQPDNMIGKYCGVLRNGTRLVESSHNALTIWWHPAKRAAGAPISHLNLGFKLMWTAFRRTQSGRCNVYTEFRCDNGDCIHKSLACDQHAHCEDQSDLLVANKLKMECSNVETTAPWLKDGLFLGICFVIVFGSVFCCVSMMICYRSWCSSGVQYTKANIQNVKLMQQQQQQQLIQQQHDMQLMQQQQLQPQHMPHQQQPQQFSYLSHAYGLKLETPPLHNTPSSPRTLRLPLDNSQTEAANLLSTPGTLRHPEQPVVDSVPLTSTALQL